MVLVCSGYAGKVDFRNIILCKKKFNDIEIYFWLGVKVICQIIRRIGWRHNITCTILFRLDKCSRQLTLDVL